MFEGSYVALVTPMEVDGSLDELALRRLVHWHIKNGTDGIVAMGTTGESPVLSVEEHCRVLDVVVKEADRKLKVIAGCGSNNTAEAIHFHNYAHSIGADAALHVTGYYNRPSQEGIFRHFEALDAENDLPIIVYNIPPRAVVDITVETMTRLSQLTSIVGVKDATRDLVRPVLEKLSIGENFSLLSGEDGTAVAYNAAGGKGCISVTANIAPALCAEMQHACLQGDFTTATRIQSSLMPLHQALFVEPSPVGVKYACSRLGLCLETTRLPMVPLTQNTRSLIDAALEGLGMLAGKEALV